MKFLFLFLFPLAAFAQSVPNGTITQGEVWTPAQWNAAWQAKQDYPIPAGAISLPSLAPIPANTVLGSVAGGAPGAIAMGSQLIINVMNYGCKGNWNGTTGTDDSTCFSNAVAAVNAAYTASPSRAAVLYMPPGFYYINAPITQFAKYVPGKVKGDGRWHSMIQTGPSFSGYVFSWDSSQQSINYCHQPPGTTCGPYVPITNGDYGAQAEDFTLFSARAYTGQNAFGFYGANQKVYFNHVNAWYFNGAGLATGLLSGAETVSNVTESSFLNMFFWADGNSTTPVVDFYCVIGGGVVCNNEISVYNLDIVGTFGDGLVIETSATGSANSSDYTFTRTRVEYGQGSGNVNLVRLGSTVNSGAIFNIRFLGLSVINVPTGSVGIHFANTTNNISQVSGIGVTTEFSGGVSNMIQIDGGKQISFEPVDFEGSSGTDLVVASSTSVGCCIYVRPLGATFSTNIDSTSIANVLMSGAVGATGWGIDPNGNVYFGPNSQSKPAWLLNGIGMQGGNSAVFTDTTSTGTGVVTETMYSWPCGALAATNSITVKNIACLYIPAPTVSAAGGGTVTPGTNGLESLVTAGGIVDQGNFIGTLGGSFSGAAFTCNASSNFNCNINTGTSTGTATLGGTTAGNVVNINSVAWQVAGVKYGSVTAPTIASGFNTSGNSITAASTASFAVTVGTGTGTSTGVLTMPAAAHGWACAANDVTTPATNMVQQTGSGTTQVTVTNYVRTTGSAGNFTNNDVIEFVCGAN